MAGILSYPCLAFGKPLRKQMNSNSNSKVYIDLRGDTDAKLPKLTSPLSNFQDLRTTFEGNKRRFLIQQPNINGNSPTLISNRVVKSISEENNAPTPQDSPVNKILLKMAPNKATRTESNEVTKKTNEPEYLYPAIVLLHAAKQTPEDVITQSTLAARSREAGYYVIAPETLLNKGYWNDGKTIPVSGEAISHTNDVGYLANIIQISTKQYPINPKLVYVVGVSNGGFMASHFACSALGADMIAGTAIVMATAIYADKHNCLDNTPQKAQSWLLFNSDSGLIVPVDGITNEIDHNGRMNERIFGVQSFYNLLTSKNRCLSLSGYEQLEHKNIGDKTSSAIKVASNCLDNTQVASVMLYGVGHQWPSHPDKRFPFFGRTNYDIDAGEAIINFFNKSIQDRK